MGNYGEIRTAEELIEYVKRNGLKDDAESVKEALDIFTRTSADDLVKLAQAGYYQNTFYTIAFRVWHWGDAVNFFNEHSNYGYKEGREAIKQAASLTVDLEELHMMKKEAHDEYLKLLAEEKIQARELRKEIEKLEGKISKLRLQIYLLEHPND